MVTAVCSLAVGVGCGRWIFVGWWWWWRWWEATDRTRGLGAFCCRHPSPPPFPLHRPSKLKSAHNDGEVPPGSEAALTSSRYIIRSPILTRILPLIVQPWRSVASYPSLISLVNSPPTGSHHFGGQGWRRHRIIISPSNNHLFLTTSSLPILSNTNKSEINGQRLNSVNAKK